MASLTIQTSRLKIRPLCLTDLSDFHVYRSNPEVTKYQGFEVMNLEEAEAFIQSNPKGGEEKAGDWVQYGIEKKSSGQLIGDCALKFGEFDPRIAEIGITISHLEQKKGFAKEALLGLLAFLFDTRSVHRVVAIVDEENLASIHLLKSVGFKQEGHFIENVFFKGKWASEFQFAYLKRDWDLKGKLEKNTR
jgi:RimJ/RimL family protein N-acetyltransferase